MGPVAKRLVPGMLAATQKHFSSLRDLHLNRAKLTTLVASITKRLLGRLAAATPVIGARLQFDAIWSRLRNNWFAHMIVPFVSLKIIDPVAISRPKC